MKLPFNVVLNPMIKPYFGESRLFCQQPMFSMSLLYMYSYGVLGFLININHIRKHLGEIPHDIPDRNISPDVMLIHDLKIIACSMGVIQYACLLVGCFTENPALFLPHLAGQIIVFMTKIFNICLLLVHLNWKNGTKIRNIFLGMLVMAFNWLQEFCVFRQILCICDL